MSDVAILIVILCLIFGLVVYACVRKYVDDRNLEREVRSNNYRRLVGLNVTVLKVEGRPDLNGRRGTVMRHYGSGLYDVLFKGEMASMGVYYDDLDLVDLNRRGIIVRIGR